MISRKEHRIKIYIVLILIILFTISIICIKYSKATDICYAKLCEIEGNSCICCLEIPRGVITCAPCPKIECPPKN